MRVGETQLTLAADGIDRAVGVDVCTPPAVGRAVAAGPVQYALVVNGDIAAAKRDRLGFFARPQDAYTQLLLASVPRLATPTVVAAKGDRA